MKTIILLLLLTASQTWAQTTLKGEFNFDKKVPFAGLVYFNEDKSLAGKEDTILNQKDKMFSQKIIAVPKDKPIAFRNSDQIDHNIFANDTDADVKFDVGLVSPGKDGKQIASWPEGTVARIGCKIHPKMRSYVAVVSSAYFAEVQFESDSKKDSFEIKDIPDKLTKITVWLPRYNPIEVEIKKGETKTVDITKPGKTTVYGKLTLKR